MTKKYIYVYLILAVMILIWVGFRANSNVFTSNPVYVIDGKEVVLGNTIRYFGNEVKYDFDGDGRVDSAFLVTQDPGGSGTFYYIVARLNTAEGARGSLAYFLGDRIAPQTTEVRDGGVVLVNYADRNPGEPFTTKPSVGKSLWLRFNTTTMNFEESLSVDK